MKKIRRRKRARARAITRTDVVAKFELLKSEAPDSTKFEVLVYGGKKKPKIVARLSVLIVERKFGVGTPMTFVEVVEPERGMAVVSNVRHVRHGRVVSVEG